MQKQRSTCIHCQGARKCMCDICLAKAGKLPPQVDLDTDLTTNPKVVADCSYCCYGRTDLPPPPGLRWPVGWTPEQD